MLGKQESHLFLHRAQSQKRFWVLERQKRKRQYRYLRPSIVEIHYQTHSAVRGPPIYEDPRTLQSRPQSKVVKPLARNRPAPLSHHGEPRAATQETLEHQNPVLSTF